MNQTFRLVKDQSTCKTHVETADGKIVFEKSEDSSNKKTVEQPEVHIERLGVVRSPTYPFDA